MIEALFLLVSFLKSGLKNQSELALENLALRQQLAILKRERPHVRLRRRERIQAIGIEEIMTAPRSPWQNPFCERLIGSICRDCLNHVILESHLRRILGRYFLYYQKYRTHLSLEKDAPEPRPIQETSLGEVIEIPEVGGLHHHYERRAA
jgi:transposase InsO family protein